MVMISKITKAFRRQCRLRKVSLELKYIELRINRTNRATKSTNWKKKTSGSFVGTTFCQAMAVIVESYLVYSRISRSLRDSIKSFLTKN